MDEQYHQSESLSNKPDSPHSLENASISPPDPHQSTQSPNPQQNSPPSRSSNRSPVPTGASYYVHAPYQQLPPQSPSSTNLESGPPFLRYPSVHNNTPPRPLPLPPHSDDTLKLATQVSVPATEIVGDTHDRIALDKIVTLGEEIVILDVIRLRSCATR
ncbi:hypothetical protein L218DRAFT_938710 [Marasmius fiardii PR-910]|nr:hypothetical protein L218DRAFT_938710 [Marasmius fiardii PR-910]